MKVKTKKFLYVLILGLIFSVSLNAQKSNSVSPGVSKVSEKKMIEPSELYLNFPEIKWDMDFAEAKQAIEKKGLQPGQFRNDKAVLMWDQYVDLPNRRGMILFAKDKGIKEIAVTFYPLKNKKAMLKSLKQKITARHGITKEIVDMEVAISYIWRLKNGFAIELRYLTEPNSSVITIHWIDLQKPAPY